MKIGNVMIAGVEMTVVESMAFLKHGKEAMLFQRKSGMNEYLKKFEPKLVNRNANKVQ